MSDLYIEARLQAIKDIASASCADIKDADNIASFCDEIYSAIPNLDKVVAELEQKKEEVQRMRNTCVALSDLEVCDIENVTYERAIEIVKQGGVAEAEQKLKEMESD